MKFDCTTCQPVHDVDGTSSQKPLDQSTQQGLCSSLLLSPIESLPPTHSWCVGVLIGVCGCVWMGGLVCGEAE